MNRLFLLRHAQAGWAQAGMSDHDRPLTPAGRADAEALGRRMYQEGYLPERVLCSGATRARQTWECVAPGLKLDESRVDYVEELYSADAADYVQLIREMAGSASSLLVVGHNPMMEDLAIALPVRAEDRATRAVAAGFPTSGLAVIAFTDPLSSLAPGKGALEAFLTS